MAKRIISAIVGISFILLVIFLSHTWHILIDIFMALVCAVAVGEFVHATGLLKKYLISIPSIAFAFCNAMLFSYNYQSIIWYVYTAIMLSAMIFFHEKLSFREVSDTYGMTIIISYGLATVISMKNLDVAHSSFYFILALALPWLADGGAYFAGSFFGKHKLCPKISPKKTWAGLIGGMATAALWGFGCAALDSLQNYAFVMVVSAVLAAVSQGGDLFESWIKRYLGVKDSGDLIPGHGGIFDRTDALLAVTPIVVLILAFFPELDFWG